MPSPFARVTNFAAGMLAVWCLGCSSFDLFLDRLAGGEAGGDTPCMTVASGNAGASVSAVSYRSHGCGCDHCVAIRSVPSAVDPVIPPVPHTIVRIVESPPSIVRTPLHPPPVA
jgi:hypothetical protein